MKVAEIKELLKGYTEKEKDRIIIELYNKIPKGMRRDKDIDYYLQNAHLNKEKEKIAYTYDDNFLCELNYFLDYEKKINIRDSLKEKYINFKAGNYDFIEDKHVFL